MPVIKETRIRVQSGKEIRIKEKDPKYCDPDDPRYVRLSISADVLKINGKTKQQGG